MIFLEIDLLNWSAIFLFWIISLVIAAYIFKSVFHTNQQLNYLNIQTKNIKTIRKIISLLAQKQGLTPDEIQQLMNESDNEVDSI